MLKERKMKKFLVALLFCCVTVMLATSVVAKKHKKGGFVGPKPEAFAVEEVLSQPDDTLVVMQGNIVKQVGKDKYQFSDKTGTIIVEIDGDEWMGVEVTPNDVIEVVGEVDKDWMSTQVDVESVAIVNNTQPQTK